MGRRIRTVDVGCAHAKLCSVLNKRFDVDYAGIEIDPVFIEAARAWHNDKFRVVHQSVVDALTQLANADVLVAM